MTEERPGDLTYLQEESFRYFLHETNLRNGLALFIHQLSHLWIAFRGGWL